jgi:hypothetical protein
VPDYEAEKDDWEGEKRNKGHVRQSKEVEVAVIELGARVGGVSGLGDGRDKYDDSRCDREV